MNENHPSFQAEDIIPRITDNGPRGEWIDFSKYSLDDLNRIKSTILQTIERMGDQLTQQVSPLDEARKLTFREVLSKTLVSVDEAIEDKTGQSPRNRE